MFQRIVVPIDGSDTSWRGLGPAWTLARQCDAPLEVVQVILPVIDNAELIERTMRDHAREELRDEVPVTVTLLQMEGTTASTIAAHADEVPGTMIVMSSAGRGRSAALVGSVLEDLLHETFGPVVVVGPQSWTKRDDFSGQLVIPVDGSATSETALALGAAWGIALHATPWVVAVADPHGPWAGDVLESSYPSRLARRLKKQTHERVEFEILHGDHPARTITTFADDTGAAFIVASTHGRSGFARIRLGSVAMDIVRHAPCPVVLQRPPHLVGK